MSARPSVDPIAQWPLIACISSGFLLGRRGSTSAGCRAESFIVGQGLHGRLSQHRPVLSRMSRARSPLASHGVPVRLCPRTRQASVANVSLGHCTVGLSYRSIQSSIRLLLLASPGRCFSTEALIISGPDPRRCLSCSFGSHRRLWGSSLHQHRRPRGILCCSPAHGLPVVDSPARARVRRHRREMD